MNRFLIAAVSFAFASSAIADATPSPSEVQKLNEALAASGPDRRSSSALLMPLPGHPTRRLTPIHAGAFGIAFALSVADPDIAVIRAGVNASAR